MGHTIYAKTPDDYESTGNNPAPWIRKAMEVSESADLLHKEYMERWHKDPSSVISVTHGGSIFIEQIFLLKSMAIENYLKALYLKQGNKIIVNDKFNKALRGHNFVDLAKQLNVKLTSPQRRCMRQMYQARTYWGAYPIPIDKKYWRKKLYNMKGINPLYYVASGDVEIANEILTKIVAMLGYT